MGKLRNAGRLIRYALQPWKWDGRVDFSFGKYPNDLTVTIVKDEAQLEKFKDKWIEMNIFNQHEEMRIKEIQEKTNKIIQREMKKAEHTIPEPQGYIPVPRVLTELDFQFTPILECRDDEKDQIVNITLLERAMPVGERLIFYPHKPTDNDWQKDSNYIKFKFPTSDFDEEAFHSMVLEMELLDPRKQRCYGSLFTETLTNCEGKRIRFYNINKCITLDNGDVMALRILGKKGDISRLFSKEMQNKVRIVMRIPELIRCK